MDGLCFCVCSDFKQVRHLEIRLSCRGWSNKEGLIHHFGVLGESVRFGVHTYSLNAKSMCCLGNTDGDFASVSDQKFFEHLFLFSMVLKIILI